MAAYEEYWELVGCDTLARETFTVLEVVVIGGMLFYTLYMLRRLSVHKPPLLLATTCLFVLGLVMFVSSMLLMLNDCFLRISGLQSVGFFAQTAAFVLSFELYIGMLFWRLVRVFKETAYRIRKGTACE